MSGIVGTLLQAFVNVEWGGVNLSNVDDGNGGKIILPQNFKADIDKDESAPSCSFELVPSPIGFNTFAELKNSALEEPINVKLGYEDGTIMEWQFRFAGMGMTTGHDPKISVDCVALVKGAFTDNKISYTLEKPITLAELPEMLKQKAGKGAEGINFKFVGGAKEKAAEIQYQENIIEQSPYSTLVNAMRPHGIQVQANDSIFSGEIILSLSPALPGEAEKDKPKVNDGSGKPEPALRTVHIISIGLMENLSRTQTFGAGQSDTKAGSSKSKTQSYEQEQIASTAPGGAQQKSMAESSNKAGGTSSTVRVPSTMSNTPDANKEDAKKGRAAKTGGVQSELKFDIMMVPYVVGMKPRDFVAIPSLDGASYIEDWEIKSVSYSQDANGLIRISVGAWRPFTGMDNLLDAATLATVTGVASVNDTPEKWSKWYWSGGRS